MASHGGNRKKRQAVNRRNGSRTKTKHGVTYRVYCSLCPQDHNPAHPEEASHVNLGAYAKRTTCKNGHRIRIVG